MCTKETPLILTCSSHQLIIPMFLPSYSSPLKKYTTPGLVSHMIMNKSVCLMHCCNFSGLSSSTDVSTITYHHSLYLLVIHHSHWSSIISHWAVIICTDHPSCATGYASSFAGHLLSTALSVGHPQSSTRHCGLYWCSAISPWVPFMKMLLACIGCC